MHSRPQHNCPCAKYPGSNPPTYVGNHYYCESGDIRQSVKGLHINDRLWDGAGCPPENSCCYVAGIMWFFLQLETLKSVSAMMRISKMKL